HDQRRLAGVDALLGPGKAAVPADEEEPSDHGGGAPVAEGHAVAAVAAANRPGIEHGPGNGEPRRHHQERRQRLDTELDPEVRRAPDDVDRRQSEPDPAGARHRPSIAARVYQLKSDSD